MGWVLGTGYWLRILRFLSLLLYGFGNFVEGVVI
jgi:hypothetical protein